MKCQTDNCDNRIPGDSKKLYCLNCRAGMRYWDKKSPGEVKYRERQLVRLQDRITCRKDRKAVRSAD